MSNPVSQRSNLSVNRLPLAQKMSRLLQGAMEAILLLLVILSPWTYGVVHAGFAFLLDAGIGLLLLLWAGRMLVERELTWQKCPVTLCLLAVILLGIWQLTPLGRPLLDRLSPKTAQLYGQFLPTKFEEISWGEDQAPEVRQAGATISLYPYATRVQLLRWLAFFWVFVLVCNNLASRAALERLALVAVVNGSLLALFALVQMFSSSRRLAYWSYPTQGDIFGPFLCKNHFPFYVNMCIGLGLGLLWSRRSSRERGPAEQRGETHRRSRHRRQVQETYWPRGASGLLQDPASLWICCALALMVTSVAFSLSRGGFLALLGGYGLCLLLQLLQTRRSVGLGAGFLCLLLTLGLVGWLGLGKIQARMATLWQGSALQESRLPLWANVFRMSRDFPLWGTGYGTYQYLEPLYRTNPVLADETIDHVHNDYLEMLAEGGLVGLFLSLLALGLIVRIGLQIVWRQPSPQVRGLALGVLFAFFTLLIHSFGDFGLRIPAIALLATVLAAQLCGLASPEHELTRSAVSPAPVLMQGTERLRWGGLVPLLGALMCVAFAWLFVQAGWRRHQTELLRLAAFREGQSTLPDRQNRQIAYLEAAVAQSPDDVELRTEVGEVYLETFRTRKEAREQEQQRITYAESAFLGPGAMLPLGVLNVAPVRVAGWLTLARVRGFSQAPEEERARNELLPALRHCLKGRACCPVSPGPYLGLAAEATLLPLGVPSATYLSQVRQLAPCDPLLLYYCGLQELRNGQKEEAWQSWRDCLEISDRYLSAILTHSSKLLPVEEVIEKILPEQPLLLWAAAKSLFPQADADPERAPFLQKTLELLTAKTTALSNEELLTKARVQKALQQSQESVASYRELLLRDPFRPEWRWELAQYLYAQGQFPQSLKELEIVLAQEPNHPQAGPLWTKIKRSRR